MDQREFCILNQERYLLGWRRRLNAQAKKQPKPARIRTTGIIRLFGRKSTTTSKSRAVGSDRKALILSVSSISDWEVEEEPLINLTGPLAVSNTGNLLQPPESQNPPTLARHKPSTGCRPMLINPNQFCSCVQSSRFYSIRWQLSANPRPYTSRKKRPTIRSISAPISRMSALRRVLLHEVAIARSLYLNFAAGEYFFTALWVSFFSE